LPALRAERWVNSALLTPDALREKIVLVEIRLTPRLSAP